MLKAFISSCQMVIILVKHQLSLCSFLRDIESVDVESIKFHFDRCDFQKWLRTTVGDEELALTIDKLDKNIQTKIFEKS